MKMPKFDKKTGLIVAVVLVVGALVLALILSSDKAGGGGEGEAGEHAEASEHGDKEHHGEEKSAKHDDDDKHEDDEHHKASGDAGPHGGKMYTKGRLAAEVVLAEDDGQARHRIWLTDGGKPVQPGAAVVSEVLRRPQGTVENIAFKPERDSFISATSIAEPHIFSGRITVRRGSDVLEFDVVSEEGKIEISDAQLKQAGVKIVRAGPAAIDSTFELRGEITFNQDRTAHVVPRLAGVVESVPANLGQSVKKGQVLAVIASTEVSGMRSELLTAQRREALARTTYQREKQLWEEKISAKQDYLQAEQELREAEIATVNARQKLQAIGAAAASSSGLNRFELRAPFDGVIVEKHIALGEAVKEEANVFTISDLSTVWAEIVVPAKDIAMVRVGEKATIKATAVEQSATGKVTYVSSLLGDQTRTAKARVTLDNPKSAWRPGLFVNVQLTADSRNAPVAVASEAIQTLDDKPTVFIKIADGFIAQAVETGRSDGKNTEIVSGLAAGTSYAATGSFVIKAEQGKGSAEHEH